VAATDRRVLVTGGAGYIGSHVVLAMHDTGRPVVVVDDLSTGNARLVPRDVPIERGDFADRALMTGVIRDYDVGAVIHLAASISVEASVFDPLSYYRNNTVASHALIETCVENGVDRFVFSSTAAVYGDPRAIPISEDAPTRPINPYGRSKLMTEWMLEDVARAHGLRYAALRYFNVAGADPQGRSGETASQWAHLVKVVSEVAVGRRPYLELYGDDYDTRDGTCIRDYIHVSDLAQAHLHLLDRLDSLDGGAAFNCGYGHGFSVREVLKASEVVIGRPLESRIAPRRAGDPPVLVADPSRLLVLGWKPQFDDLQLIIRSAIDWERRLHDSGP
jgi:UDP-glucose 4-epimerase